MKGNPYRILVVETDELRSHTWKLQARQWKDQLQIQLFRDLRPAAVSSASQPYDGVIIGIDLLNEPNRSLLSRARLLFAHLAILVVSNTEEPMQARNFLRSGFQDFLVDGQYSPQQLSRSIVCAIERRKILQQYQQSWKSNGYDSYWEVESLITRLMATLQMPVRDLVAAINQLPAAHGVDTRYLGEYASYLKASAERLEKRYLHFLYLQHNLRSFDCTVLSFDVGQIVDQVLKNFLSTLDHLDASVRVEILRQRFVGAPEIFAEILYQLMSNAVKFRSAERRLQIHIRVKCLPSGTLKVSVADNGQGINLGHDPTKIFQLVYQEQQLNSNRETRTGLYVMKNLVDRCQGAVSVQSKVNRGSIFSVYLPDGLLPERKLE